MLRNDEVRVAIHVEYTGTLITKSVVASGNGSETPATLVNRALEHATKKIQIMVQSEQGVQ